MSFNRAELRRLKDAFKEAAKNYPYPDKPLISMGTITLSMTELAKEVENETAIGRRLLHGIEMVISSGETTLDVTRQVPEAKTAEAPD